MVGPASLTAGSYRRAQVTLGWPSVAGAERDRLTRIANVGHPEVTIDELPAGSFVFEGATCVAGSSLPNCVYVDVHQPAGFVLNGAQSRYPHDVIPGVLHTYRVRAIFSGSVLSPPRPPATVRVQ